MLNRKTTKKIVIKIVKVQYFQFPLHQTNFNIIAKKKHFFLIYVSKTISFSHFFLIYLIIKKALHIFLSLFRNFFDKNDKKI